MQLKTSAYLILFTYLAHPLSVKSLPQKRGCDGCVEEVWEEVLCGSIPANTPAVAPVPTTTATTTTPTPTPTPAKSPTTWQPNSITTSAPTNGCSNTDPYSKCEYECKLGCKKFCRKVVANPAEKRIVQVSKMTEPFAKGHIKLTHILQRELIPTADVNENNINEHYAPSDTHEGDAEAYRRLQLYPSLPIASSREEESEVKPAPFFEPYYKTSNIHSENNVAKAPAPLIQPVYSPYGIPAESVSEDFQQLNPYLFRSQHPAYYGPPRSSADYDYSLPFENVYRKVTRSAPAPDRIVSLDEVLRKTSKPRVKSNVSSVPAKSSALHAHETFDQYDVSLNSVLGNLLTIGPSNQARIYPLRYTNV